MNKSCFFSSEKFNLHYLNKMDDLATAIIMENEGVNAVKSMLVKF